MPEDSDRVEFRDAQVGNGGDCIEGNVLRELLLNLASLPGGSRSAEHEVELGLAGLGDRNGGFDGLNGSEDGRKGVEDGKKGVHAWMIGRARADSRRVAAEVDDRRGDRAGENP